MNKTEILKDATKVSIRNLKPDDLDRLMKFYRTISERDRKYLRVDVTDREKVKQRIKLIRGGNLVRIVALQGKEIISDGALELFGDEWRKHQGELRVIVAKPFQRKGLGAIMMRELYFLASQKKVKTLIVRMMRPQKAARKICRKLGFREELLIPDYIQDLTGATQDMVIMTCDMQEFWEELEHFYSDSDWQKSR